ncbi:MAG: hypothetical protein ACOCYG_08570, partial [Spirochaetota bacterium]
MNFAEKGEALVGVVTRKAILPGEAGPGEAGTRDVGIRGGTIVEVSEGIAAKGAEENDAAGRFVSPPFVSPPFVDAHFHLDSVWTRVPNDSGTLRLGMEGRVAASHVTSMETMDPYYVRRKLVPIMASTGVQAMSNPLINVLPGGHEGRPHTPHD